MIRIVWVIRSLLSFFVSAAVSFFVLKTMVFVIKASATKTLHPAFISIGAGP